MFLFFTSNLDKYLIDAEKGFKAKNLTWGGDMAIYYLRESKYNCKVALNKIKKIDSNFYLFMKGST